jgi:hypothetical protein
VRSTARGGFDSSSLAAFDPRHNIDGLSKPVVIPPAYGLEGIHHVTFTGDGTDVAYWNRYVAVAEMGGLGSVSEPRLNLSITHGTEDLVTSKLPALQAYELSLKAPAAPVNSFDAAAAGRGKLVFDGAGKCATCHSGAELTDANERLHPPSDSVTEPETPSYASRSATKQYRTTPLKGAWQHAPYFHDGSVAPECSPPRPSPRCSPRRPARPLRPAPPGERYVGGGGVVFSTGGRSRRHFSTVLASPASGGGNTGAPSIPFPNRSPPPGAPNHTHPPCAWM